MTQNSQLAGTRRTRAASGRFRARWLRASFALLLAALLFAVPIRQTLAQEKARPGDELLGFLKQSIEWYQHVQLPAEIAGDPVDSIYSSYNRNVSLQALTLIFEFARLQAQQIESQNPSSSAAPDGGDQAAHNLAQLLPKAQAKVQQESAALAQLEHQAATAAGKKRKTLDEQIATRKSELDLAQARLEAVESMNTFAAAGTSAGLPGKVNELERTVPEVRLPARSSRLAHAAARNESTEGAQGGTGSASTGGTASTAGAGSQGAAGSGSAAPSASEAVTPFAPPPTAAPAAQSKPASDSILSLASQLFSLTSKLGAEQDAIQSTNALRSSLQRVRQPLSAQLRTITQQGDALAAQPDSSDPAVLAERQQQTEALTTGFRQLSATLLPLAKASILLDASANNLAQWRSETQRTYTARGRSLFLRVSILAFALLAVFVAGNFWRRAIFRYIRDQRRRNQFLLLRRIVVALIIALILLFGLSTELGSLATFAGFLTAGIAFALQNVILSIAAYFFLIGRYGIRVGDRIQIGDVTGDVVDIGLVRLHLVELDASVGEARPTGRIVVFSNSVVFQPTSNFFKQLPGSNFAWRRISLTLAPDVDYALAQQRISAAVAEVYGSYKHELDYQHGVLERSLAVQIARPEPQTRLRLQQAGLEIVILYPVVLSQSAQIDDRMTAALLEAIANEPGLRLVGGGLTAIKPIDATPGHPVSTS